MNFRNYSALKGKHAFLGASKYHWINYDEERLAKSYFNYRAAERGTEDHEFAATCIRRRQRLPRSQKTLNMYVNDAIKFKMEPEVVLYFSDNCFGTADAISFNKNFLRIHDLKTGVTPAHMEQLMVYAALFCLDYGYSPDEIEMELRIYQSSDIMICNPDPKEIMDIIEKILYFDPIVDELKERE